MSQIRITKEFSFEAAHALKDYDGPCKNIHGHSYQLSVTILGEPKSGTGDPKNGMVMDFGDLKKIIKKNVIDIFDHALILNSGSRDIFGELPDEHCENTVFVDYQPTSENLLIDFASRISSLLPSPVRLFSLKLRETANSYAEWYADDNKKG
jgi:6-pyruvoyltetrahydropterin/6-carboxytetrahydropterin synthase